MSLSNDIADYVACHGVRWRPAVREWWLALADAMADESLHIGGVCGAKPCLLHDRVAEHSDHERNVYSRAEAAEAYRAWQQNPVTSEIDFPSDCWS